MQTALNGTPVLAQGFISLTEPTGQNCSVHILRPEEVDLFWNHVEPLLKKVVPHSEGELEPEDFLPLLKTGEMDLWIVIMDKRVIAAMITQVIPYPRKNVCRILAIAGEGLHIWMKHFPMLEEWARQRDCKHIELWGRKGWLRVLKNWKNSYHILTKEI